MSRPLLFFVPQLREYLPSLELYEFGAEPEGLTLQYFLPRALARALPFLTLGLVLALIQLRVPRAGRRRSYEQASVPAALAVVLQTTGFGTIVYEYRTVALLGLIPLLLVWLERGDASSGTGRRLVAFGFALFLLVAFRVVAPPEWVSSVAMAAVYLVGSLYFLALAIESIVRRRG